MRIRSNFHDYYDTAMGHGQDPNLIYVRESRRIVQNPGLGVVTFSGYHGGVYTRLYVARCILGFCGRLFRSLIIQREEANSIITFSIDTANEEITSYSSDNWFTTWGLDKLKQFFQEDLNKYEELFQQYKVPVFVIIGTGTYSKPGHELILNPCLKDYGFQKLVDPYTAFQEISVYLGGVLGNNEDKIPEVNEEDRIASRGFNKQSFRKAKQDGPKRKKHRSKPRRKQ